MTTRPPRKRLPRKDKIWTDELYGELADTADALKARKGAAVPDKVIEEEIKQLFPELANSSLKKVGERISTARGVAKKRDEEWTRLYPWKAGPAPASGSREISLRWRRTGRLA